MFRVTYGMKKKLMDLIRDVVAASATTAGVDLKALCSRVSHTLGTWDDVMHI